MVSSIPMATYPTGRYDASEAKVGQLNDLLGCNQDGVLADYGSLCAVSAGSGMQVIVASGRLVIAGFVADIPANQPLTIANADPTNPRIDRVVAELNVTTPATISIRVITGVPGVSPATPAIDETFQTPLALITVGAGVSSIVSGNVLKNRFAVGFSAWATWATTIVAGNGGGGLATGTSYSSAARFTQWRFVPGRSVEFYIDDLVALSGTQQYVQLLYTSPIPSARAQQVTAAAMNDIALASVQDQGAQGNCIAISPYGNYGPGSGHVGQWYTDGFGRYVRSQGTYPYGGF